MSMCVLLLLAVGDGGQVESKDFSKDAQTAALRASVKVVNVTTNRDATAVIIKQQGKFVYFLTAAHVARTTDKLELHTYTAESYPEPAEKYRSAEVIAIDKERDLAVLRLATTDAAPGVLSLCPPKKVEDGKGFAGLSVGCGGGKAPVCQVETVRRKVKVQRPSDKEATLVWEIAAAPANGRSGGPLVDKRGLVIGIASGANDNMGYYVHIEEIQRFLKKNALEWLYEEEKK